MCASNGTTFPNRCVLDCAIKTNPSKQVNKLFYKHPLTFINYSTPIVLADITFGHDGDCEDKRGDKSAGGGKAGAWGTTAGPNNPYLIALITFTFMSYFGFKFCM